MNRRQHRSWFRFGLRSLLLASLVAALASLWLRHRVEQGQQQAENVAILLQAGATPQYRHQFDQTGRWNQQTESDLPQPVRDLLGNETFAAVKSVKHHGASQSELDRELPALQKLNGTTRLVLGASEVSDQQLAQISKMSALEELFLEYTKVTDDGIAVLTDLPRLRVLNLRGAEVTDSSLVHLRQLESLEQLDIRGTRISPDAASTLKSALPGCRIKHD